MGVTGSSRVSALGSEDLRASLAGRLAAFATSVRPEDIPPGVTRLAAGLVLDWLGCALGGLLTRPGAILLAHAREQPRGVATALGLPEGRSPQAAAFHNGALSHIVEMDDVERGSVIHPGAVVIPAALAVGEKAGVSGARFLAGAVLGYETAIRIGEAVGKSHYYHWHNTSTCGGFGAAVAASYIIGLTTEQMVWALGSAGTQAGGLWQFVEDGAMSKHLHAGRAAANGVLAAELAALGFTGAGRILEGRRGFFAATSRDARPEIVAEGLEPGMKAWRLERVSVKPYPSCRHTHSAVDAALSIRQSHDFSAGDIESVVVYGYRAMLDVTDKPAPSDGYSAKFSLQYCVASALARGRLSLEDFSPDALEDPAVQRLAFLVSARHDPLLESRYPAQFPARVQVKLRSRPAYTQEVTYPRGDPESPLSESELENKFRQLLAGTQYQALTESLIVGARSLGEQPHIGSLTGLLRAASAPVAYPGA